MNGKGSKAWSGIEPIGLPSDTRATAESCSPSTSFTLRCAATITIHGPSAIAHSVTTWKTALDARSIPQVQS
jgi:hypothetical protein